jgi:hypothetical protein
LRLVVELGFEERERERKRASDRARSGVVDGEEEEAGRNNFATDRFASQEEMNEIPVSRGRELSTERRRRRRGELILQQIDLLLRKK